MNPNQPMLNQQLQPQNSMTGQYGQQQPMTGQYGQQQPMTGQYGQQQPMTGQYGQQQPMTGQYGQQQPMTGQYGQQQPGMMGQQPGMMGQYGQQQPGMMGQYGQQPKLQIFARGQGIDQNEYNAIISGCSMAYTMKATPMSNNAIKNIKNSIRGEWFVFVCPVGNKQYDFSLSIVTGADFISFALDDTQFQVCRLSN
jgi:hypothetical protein